MRLINTTSLELEEFFEKAIPKYAILSHRWEAGEVNYKDYTKKRYLPTQDGYRKIKSCCELARKRGQEYVWIDTCCIDKRSSAELSEAINSMYKWYQDAAECYVYLFDVQPYTESPEWQMQFSSSTWFERGWTLQELLAPCMTLFCGGDWSLLGVGTMHYDASREIKAAVIGLKRLDHLVRSVVRIPADALDFPRSIRSYSVARRLSWASRRKTTRVEDEACCLLGIMGVNMPLLYGEGRNAFRRLQLEIMRQTADESILAFDRSAAEREDGPIELLAHSSSQFGANRIICPHHLNFRRPFAFAGVGLQLSSLQALEQRSTFPSRRIMSVNANKNMILYSLACRDLAKSETSGYWLLLVLQPCGHYYLRAAGHDLAIRKDCTSTATSHGLIYQGSLTWAGHDLVQADLQNDHLHVHNQDQTCISEDSYYL